MVFLPLSHYLLYGEDEPEPKKKIPFTSGRVNLICFNYVYRSFKGVIEVYPQVNGQWNWITENELQFLPDQLKPGMELTITVCDL
jgi:hypothetical protein